MNNDFTPPVDQPSVDGSKPKTLGDLPDWRKILRIVGIGVVVITTLVVGTFTFMIWNFVNEVEGELFDTASLERPVEALAADLGTLRAAPFFQDVLKDEALTDPELDAGQYLNRMLTWNDVAAVDAPPPAGGLELPGFLTERLDDWGGEWSEHAADVPLETVDFAWLADLKKYRYWNLETDSPLGDALRADPKLDPSMFPTPEFKPLTYWVQLRLLSALKAQDPEPALAEVRHLAHLCLTVPSVVAEMLGVKYLNYVEGVARHLGRPAMDQDLLVAARRSLWVQQDYLDFTIPEPLYRKVYPEGVGHPGACAALEERAAFANFAREAFEEAYPERLRTFERRMDEIGRGCRTGPGRRHYDMKLVPAMLVGVFFGKAHVDGTPVDAASDAGAQWAAVKSFGFLRKVIGLLLAHMAKDESAPTLYQSDGDQDDTEAP